NNQCVLVRRDSGEKVVVSLDRLETEIPVLLDAVSTSLFQKAAARRDQMTYTADNLDDMIKLAEEKPGFIKAMWCGDRECEEKLKELTGVSSRCMPFEQNAHSDKCVCCGKPAEKLVYWGKAY
ncbi:MAG: proline--tRNA ligase, partial [Oscillospiraceae bacterium]